MRDFFHLDPRTKLFFLLMEGIFVLASNFSSYFPLLKYYLGILPFVLRILMGNYKSFLKGIVVYAAALATQQYWMPHLHGTASFVALAITGVVLHFLPGFLFAAYCIRNTKVSEFIAAMHKKHLSDKVVIPLSVMFRFFPTIFEEPRAIGSAMKMRNIRAGKVSLLSIIEYRLVPTITCSARAGEELNQAAVTRGLGGPWKRTNICEIGLHAFDYIMYGVLVLVAVISVLLKTGVFG